MKFLLIPMLVIGLTSCTAEQAYRTAAEVGEAGKALVMEKILVRQEYRTKQREIVDAAYSAEMRAADEAERTGDIAGARLHWASAWAVLEDNMPSLESVKRKVKRFLHREVDLGDPLSTE